MVLHTTYVLWSTIKLWCCVSFFWLWWEIVFGVSYIWYLLYSYSCAVVSVFWLWWEIVLKIRTRFYKKNLIGLLYYDPIADVGICKTKHSFTLYLSILYISLVPHRFAH